MNLINAPEYANDYEFVVARQIDDDLWFWGAYTDGFKAEQVALEIGGIIVHNLRIQGKRR
jgi:hypothetical protein